MPKAIKEVKGLRVTITKTLEESLGELKAGFSEKRFRKNIKKAAKELSKGFKAVESVKDRVKAKRVAKTV
jgi:hypothetical protein